MQSELVTRLNKQDPAVVQSYDKFENFYGNSFRRTTISEIIDGENIRIEPENIRIDDPVDESIINVEQVDELFKIFCTKVPYQYQRQAILKILELEQKQEHVNPVDNTTIVSNGYQLALPIGSGKSLIFEFLALFYPKVPKHPIIVSTDGRHIPNDQLPFENYPFYYENTAYCKETANAVMVITTTLQRECTVILTYSHLLPQLRQYFKDDFTSGILAKRNIVYVDCHELSAKIEKNQFDLEKTHVLVVVADEPNVDKLIELSYIKPFSRVIIDDYTNMTDLPKLRQILAFSFIPVSGSGFEGSISQIPSSYYSLKNVNYKAIKLVGDPEKTYEGVMRSNILTGEILSTSSDFDIYTFVSMVEDLCRRLPGCEKKSIDEVFEEFKTNSLISTYIKYGFFLQNIQTFKKMLPMLITDLQNGLVPKEKVSFFVEWFNNTKDNIFKNNLCSPTNANNTSSPPTLLNSDCVICGSSKEKTYGFGIIASCCGAFICNKCIEQAATKKMINVTNPSDQIIDDENYYCVCCRAKNPKYFFNSTQHSNNSETRSFIMAERYFQTDCEEHFSVDYYFEMLLKNGWLMKNESCCGKPLNIHNDIENSLIPANIFKTGKIPIIEKLKNSDILFPQVLQAIYKTYVELKIKPAKNSMFLVYKCKPILQQRMVEKFKSLQYFEDPKTGKLIKDVNSPFSDAQLLFRDSVGSVIGLSLNLAGILVYNPDDDESYSILQLVGRVLRISTYKQPIIFYISNNSKAYE